MTDEQLQEDLKAVEEALVKLPDEKSMTGKDRTEKVSLMMQKDALERIKHAREKGNLRDEMKHTVNLAAIRSIKNPWLLYLAQIKFKSHIFG